MISTAQAAAPAFREGDESAVTQSSAVGRLMHLVVPCPCSGP